MSPVLRFSIALAGCALVAAPAPAAPVAAQLSFVPLLPGALTGRPDAPAVTVLVQAANGTLIAGATNAVTISVGQNPAGARLSGTLTVAAQGGLANFPDLVLDRDGDGFTLLASAASLAPGQTAPFSFHVPPDPHDAEGFGCGSAGMGPLAFLAALVALAALRRRRRAAALLLLCAGLLQAPAARAADAPGKADLVAAKDLNSRGLAALEAGHFDDAIGLFDQARLHVDSPSLLYNLAEAHRRAGHTEEALALYRDYLRRVPDPARRADVSKFEALERTPQPAAPSAAAPAAAAARSPSSRTSAPPPGPRRFVNSPGAGVSLVWDPIAKRVGAEVLLGARVSDWFSAALGASISSRPGGRLMLSRALYDDEDFAVGVALRGILAPFPGSPVVGGGGGFSFAAHVNDQLDLTLGTYYEGMHTTGVTIGAFLVTLGVAGHL